MTKLVLTDLNLNQNEIQNAVEQNLATAPANPKEGQHYYNTTTHKWYIYNGTEWVDATSQGKIYTFSDGVTLDDATDNVTLDKASKTAIGGVIVGDNIAVATDGTISVADASTSAKGLIEIADDTEATAGTATDLAITPKQLNTATADKLVKNEDIVAGTHTKITYDAKGLVTAGEDLTADDIPDLSATYIKQTDKGVAGGVASLDTDGKVPAAQLPSYVDDVIDAYIVGETALAEGWLSATEGGAALTPETGKIYVVLTAGEYANKTYRWSGTTYVEISASPAQATESVAGIAQIATTAEVAAGTNDTKFVTPLKLAGALISSASKEETLTNKTISADNNTITDLELDNFKDGVVQTAVRDAATATDTAIATEKAVATALAEKTEKLTATNEALIPAGGIATWTIANTLATEDVIVTVKEVASGDEVICDVSTTAANIVIKMNATANITAGTYKAIIIG